MLRAGLLGLLLTGSVVAVEAVAAPPAVGLAPGARNRVTGELCDPARTMQVGTEKAPKARNLGELPPGNVVLTVVREMDGCAAPVVVRQGLSGSPGAKATRRSRARR